MKKLSFIIALMVLAILAVSCKCQKSSEKTETVRSDIGYNDRQYHLCPKHILQVHKPLGTNTRQEPTCVMVGIKSECFGQVPKCSMPWGRGQIGSHTDSRKRHTGSRPTSAESQSHHQGDQRSSGVCQSEPFRHFLQTAYRSFSNPEKMGLVADSVSFQA